MNSLQATCGGSQVPTYTLPDPLTLDDGTPVADATLWFSVRRPQILELFRSHVYGRAPGTPSVLDFQIDDVDPAALSGRAVRRQVTVRLSHGGTSAAIHVLLYLPRAGPRPAPAFVGLNFHGNHTVHPDPAIHLTQTWVPARPELGTSDHRATAKSRGASASRWPVEAILARGYALATAYCGDIDPDYDDGFRNGVHRLFRDDHTTGRGDDDWGTIGAWAWGLSRVMDYLTADEDVDQERVAVMGHSRLGKTALWAGAQDQRFALVVSNNSGCGGAALSRRRFGESVEAINARFPHWFCRSFHQYGAREKALPVDQHMLIALIAPRPAYIASAAEDLWADPRGEFLAAVHATPVYRLLGLEGLPDARVPDVDQPLRGTLGYHVRSGVHDVTPYDWARYLDFAEDQLTPD